MTRWSAKELGMIVPSVFMMYVLTRWTAGAWELHAFIGLSAFFLTPFLCSAAIAWFLKRRGRRLWVCGTLLAALVVLLVGLARNLTAATELLSWITGHYNAEAAAFYLIYGILFCGGMLLGLGAGAWIWKYTNKTES